MRKSYSERFAVRTYKPSPESTAAAKAVDDHLFKPAEKTDMLDTVMEWISEGWEFSGFPTPPMIAAALLNHAESLKTEIAEGDGDSTQEAVESFQDIAAEILAPLIPLYPTRQK